MCFALGHLHQTCHGYLFVNCYSLGEISKFNTFYLWFSLNQNAFHIWGSNFKSVMTNSKIQIIVQDKVNLL